MLKGQVVYTRTMQDGADATEASSNMHSSGHHRLAGVEDICKDALHVCHTQAKPLTTVGRPFA